MKLSTTIRVLLLFFQVFLGQLAKAYDAPSQNLVFEHSISTELQKELSFYRIVGTITHDSTKSSRVNLVVLEDTRKAATMVLREGQNLVYDMRFRVAHIAKGTVYVSDGYSEIPLRSVDDVKTVLKFRDEVEVSEQSQEVDDEDDDSEEVLIASATKKVMDRHLRFQKINRPTFKTRLSELTLDGYNWQDLGFDEQIRD